MSRKAKANSNKALKTSAGTRRRFLKAMGPVTTGSAALALPMIAKGQQGPITMRFQSTWPSKDIFHEYAQDYAKIVNDMTGGDLKIEVLPAGAVVPAFGLLEAVSKGTLDGGHGVLSPLVRFHCRALGYRGDGALSALGDLKNGACGDRPLEVL